MRIGNDTVCTLVVDYLAQVTRLMEGSDFDGKLRQVVYRSGRLHRAADVTARIETMQDGRWRQANQIHR